MAGKFKSFVVELSGKSSKIHSRIGHITVPYSNFIVVWGGYKDPPDSERHLRLHSACYYPPEQLLLYDTECEIWHEIRTRGQLPPKLCGSTAAVCGHHLYLYGGFCEELQYHETGGNLARLYQLDLTTMEWRLLRPLGLRPPPCDKLVSWSADDAVYILHGFGPRPPGQLYSSKGVEFVSDPLSGDFRGWIGQLARYRPSRLRWEWPATSGTPPCPRAAHAAARVGDDVYVFGGRMHRRLNDIYRLRLSQMHWERLVSADPEAPLPQCRSWHSLTALSPHHLLLYGGFNNFSEALDDPWLYDTRTGRWLPAAGCQPPGAVRMWHAAAAVAGEVLMVGGIKCSILAMPPASFATEVVTLRSTPRSLLRLSLEVVERHWSELREAVRLLPTPLRKRVHARVRAGHDQSPQS